MGRRCSWRRYRAASGSSTLSLRRGPRRACAADQLTDQFQDYFGAAQTDSATGKIHMLGAGWTITGSPTAPHAVALMIKVLWDCTNQKLPVRVELVTGDGQPVTIPGPTGPQPVISQIDLEAGRPPGIAPGSTLSAVFAVNMASIPLSPGLYEWRASVDGRTQGGSFQVMASPAHQ
ncbi:MAG: DUF6941 family protein [Pseudonocardiaceae bacterium]